MNLDIRTRALNWWFLLRENSFDTSPSQQYYSCIYYVKDRLQLTIKEIELIYKSETNYDTENN